MVWEGAKAVELVRKLLVQLNLQVHSRVQSEEIMLHMSYARADELEIGVPNLIHASDSSENAQKEISLWFSEAEIFDNYETVHSKFM